MNKSSIYLKLKELYPKLSAIEVKQLVDGMIRGMEDALIDNNRIEIRGFGVFSIKAIRKTVMVNPRYNTIENKQHVTQSVHFKMGKELKLKVNKSALM